MTVIYYGKTYVSMYGGKKPERIELPIAHEQDRQTYYFTSVI